MVDFAERVLMELEGMLHDFGGSKGSSLSVTVLVFCCKDGPMDVRFQFADRVPVLSGEASPGCVVSVDPAKLGKNHFNHVA